MSQELAQAFLERMRSDETFIDAVIRIEDVETKMAFIQRQGYQFTVDELDAASDSMI
jgi:predicted ribosomally synthesized peptide with nif11-like leader